MMDDVSFLPRHFTKIMMSLLCAHLLLDFIQFRIEIVLSAVGCVKGSLLALLGSDPSDAKRKHAAACWCTDCRLQLYDKHAQSQGSRMVID